MKRGGYREREGVRRRAQAGANAWRAVEVVMTDRRIFKRLKVMRTFNPNPDINSNRIHTTYPNHKLNPNPKP